MEFRNEFKAKKIKLYKSFFLSISMQKEDIGTIAQLLSGIRDALDKMEKAKRTKEIETFNEAKKEIIEFQEEIKKLL